MLYLPTQHQIIVPLLSHIISSSDTVLGPVPCHNFLSQVAEREFEQIGHKVRELLGKYIYREVNRGVVVRVGVDFLELEIESCLDFERVSSILVSD